MIDVETDMTEIVLKDEFYCGSCYSKLEQVGSWLQCPSCRQAY